uniref:Pentraxin family member n=1 Tax=Bubo bubo TaxID=30461 RepID=A0A8C0EQ34_BUBBB
MLQRSYLTMLLVAIAWDAWKHAVPSIFIACNPICYKTKFLEITLAEMMRSQLACPPDPLRHRGSRSLFQLRGFVDEEGFVRFALIVHGHHSPYLPVFRADGQWHHFCVTWQQENGTWAIYADGKRRASANGLCAVGPSAPQAIYGQGTFIIGQDQDSLGGTFKEKESFSGNITDLHVWQKVLGAEQIEKVRSAGLVVTKPLQ